jgi:hypothetical protein
MIVGWTAAIIISGILIARWIAGWFHDGDCFQSEDEIACAGAEGALSIVKWFFEVLLFIVWPAVWYAGFEGIRFVAERRDAREQRTSSFGQ